MYLDIEVVAEFQAPEELEDCGLSQHHRGVALLPGEQPWLKVGAEGCCGCGIESCLAVRTAQSATSSQRAENHPTRIRILGGVVGDHRTKIRIGEPGDLCLVQLRVRSGPVGDREVVVLGRGSDRWLDHLGRLASGGFLRRLEILRWLAGRGNERLGILLGRVGQLGDLEPYSRRGSRPEEIGNLGEPGQRRERSELDAPTLAGEPSRIGDVPQDLVGNLRIGCSAHGVLTLCGSRRPGGSASRAVPDQRENMRRIVVSEPDESMLSPAPRLSCQLIVDEVDVPRRQSQGLHVQVELGLDDVMRIQADNHEHHIVAAPLGVDQRVGVWGVVEMQVAQLLQCGVLFADLVQLSEQHVEVLAALFGGLPVARAVLELLRVQVLLTALSERRVLEQLET